ncbi:E3 ubiquitin-protein ligase AMFR-like isoform X1 [Haliotis rufescens]|uniref:E3 ubiquitin-protein ligase AMFR-like isoform X1 n=1 Tax=Haliotis rufescens TaxID=6454 RepID=UPI001EB0A734|nr:E3 ubiquitin-protein ligase AMFR-like isoform X1 [Haliotis rufescens]
MPAILLERIPLPSLQTYTAFSTVLLTCALFYTHQTVTSTPFESLEQEVDAPIKTEVPVTENLSEDDPEIMISDPWNTTLPYDSYEWNFLFVMTTQAWCVWTLVNTAYCCLILLGKLIQRMVFGELRVSEQQHLKDKFWNFVFYKFIFIFGVMNVQTMEEVVLWVAWFSVLGFFHLLTQLCKDRFEYLSFSPTTARYSHVKLLSLLWVILVSCGGLLLVCVYVGLQVGLTILAFMAAECLLLGIRALYVVVRYIIHLWDMSKEGVWENRSMYVYYAELIFELAALSIDFCHHLHMLLWGNIFLSMASLVICMQLRYLFYEFQRRVKRHKNYLRVVKNMEARFPMATQEDLEQNNDDCAICWERMESARKLPCCHLFHNSCLRSWLEQDTSCPTCRMPLSDGQRERQNVPQGGPAETGNAGAPPAPPANAATTNHFFHFDASRYVSWLPSFSVEVTHTNLLTGQQQARVSPTSQLDNMARQVQAVFPNMPLATIVDDLGATRSVNLTIDNILEGRLVAPPTPVLANRPSVDNDTDDEQNMQQIAVPSTVSRTGLMGLRAALGDTHLSVGDNTDSQPGPLLAQAEAMVLNSGDFRHSEDVPSPLGGRFSKSASERMSMLEHRKTSMVDQARRKYLQKNKHNTESGDLSSSSQSDQSDDSRSQQREVIFQAAQRRLNSIHHSQYS